MAGEANAGSEGWWTETEARTALAELARSGESELLFARRRGYSRERLRYWKRKLAVSTEPTMTKKPAFVAVAMPIATRIAAKIEIQVGAVKVCVREDMDVDHLARVVDALARLREC